MNQRDPLEYARNAWLDRRITNKEPEDYVDVVTLADLGFMTIWWLYGAACILGVIALVGDVL